MSVQGLKAIARAIAGHQKATERGVRVGHYRAGLYLQRESQKIVPVDTAALKASANTRLEGSGTESQVVVSYGTDYAVYVHEDLQAKHAPGKTAKYLEIPARQKRGEMTRIVKKAIAENQR